MATAKVNQVPYDFQSMEVELVSNGESFGIIEGLEEIEYTCTINREKMYGRSRNPVKRTDGVAEYAASMTIHRDWWHYLVAKSKELGIPLGLLEMTLGVSYFAEGAELVTDTVTGVKLAEIGNSYARGPEGLLVPVPLDIMNVYYSGVDVFGNTL